MWNYSIFQKTPYDDLIVIVIKRILIEDGNKML